MTKSQLISIVARQAHLPKRAAAEAVETLFEEMIRALQKGDKVVISGFGTFYVATVNNKEVVPFGNEAKRQTIPQHKVINFRTGKPLKKTIW